MVETAVQAFGGLDVLHNNASDVSTTARDTDVVTLDMEIFDRLVAVNLKGPFLGCKHAIPHMLGRGAGSIVNTASIDGFMGRGVRAAYGACKSGVVLLTKSVASQYGSRGIRCNAVVPGFVLTPATADATAENARGRANAVVFLASDEAGFINGTTLMVEGGATIYMPSAQLDASG
jgi:NAD(P)-dependent dehydrogenase (short-subunit alcohol dehydrogenase family)